MLFLLLTLYVSESPGFVGFKNSALGKTKMCLFTKKPVLLGKEGQTHGNNAALKAGNLRLSLLCFEESISAFFPHL